MDDDETLAATTEIGSLGVAHLRRLWSAAQLARQGQPVEREAEGHLDRLVLDALGLGLQQTIQFLHQDAPSFQQFEEWIVATVGSPPEELVDRLNADLTGATPPPHIQQWLDEIQNAEQVLTPEDLSSWEEKGYVVLKNAVSLQACADAERAIWEHVGADPEQPESWYRGDRTGIMVELIQHPALNANRKAARIHKAFAQLWGTADLWASSDRCGFHVPQRPDRPFPGPDLHWDMSFDQPDAFGTQGILYLTDTPAEQGALTLVPGFHRRLPDWLGTLECGSDPQQQDLHALGTTAVGGSAGDMVIWHHALPHGSSPNRGMRPRIVQYINMYPGRDVFRTRVQTKD